MTLQQLKYAIAVSECGNITAASQKFLFLSQVLQLLFVNLKKKLVFQFSRTNKGVIVTNEGNEF